MATEGTCKAAWCKVSNGEGGQRRAWYYHFVEIHYRMVMQGTLGVEQIDLDSKLPSVQSTHGHKWQDAKERPSGRPATLVCVFRAISPP